MSLSTLPRTLSILDAVIMDGGASSVAALARHLGMPVSTTHRHVEALVDAGFLAPASYGRHIAGPRLRALAQRVDDKQIIANAAAPILHRLAAKTGCIVQLGTFENDMVTYRIKTGRGSGDLFTKVGMQLEAYCSGIGKVLLAHLDDVAREAYLATGPFPALTGKTITDPASLRAELDTVRGRGFAVDDEEVKDGLRCLAIPLEAEDGRVIAAISASRNTRDSHRPDDETLLALLKDVSRQIVRDGPTRSPRRTA
jgi:DNA-binding IclR family transcriptional regulator